MKRNAALMRVGRKLGALLPKGIRRWLKKYLSMAELERERRAQQHPLAHRPDSEIPAGSPCTVGIFKEYYSYHKDYVYACRDIGVGYRLLDIAATDWLERVKQSGCQAFLAWPSNFPLEWKNLFDDRLRILSEDLGVTIFPSEKETWLYESKRRTRDWLDAHGLPHPETLVFFDRGEAERHLERARFPLVLKTNTGASASGVFLLRDMVSAKRLVRRAFTSGIVPKGQHRKNRQGGVVFLQEYLANVKEWRMVRVGDSYFGYRKEPGEEGFHSASKMWSWLDPGRELLELTRRVTDAGGFRSMNVDVFETQDGRLLVNELQTVFGATTPADQLRIDGVAGRYVPCGSDWRFEPGPFSKNSCANLRLQFVVEEMLGAELPSSEWVRECDAARERPEDR